MAVNAISGYDSLLNYQNWVDNANTAASSYSTSSAGKTSGTSDTGSTSTSKSTDSTSSSAFLLNYQMKLTDLESASARLRTTEKDNVFSKYESALDKLSKATTDEEKEAAQTAVDKAKEEIGTALQDFADKYNNTISFLESNAGRSNAVASQLASMKRAMPTSGALKTVGMGFDAYGKLQVNKDKLNEALDETYAHVKETVGGRYGIAERTGDKASSILDSSVDKILGTSGTKSTESTGGSKGNKNSKASSSVSDSYSMPDSLTSFYNFARAGAYNLSNYYAVGMLLNTTA